MLLREEIINDLKEIECELGTPTFSYNSGAVSGTWNLIPSITDFNRALDLGGFNIVRLMTATVRMYDVQDDCGNTNYIPLFPNGLPMPQQILTYSVNGEAYRIESIKRDPTNSYFRLVAHSTTKTK